MSKQIISFVAPVYKCRDCLLKLIEEIEIVCQKIDVIYEIILVDDCCPENSWQVIQEISNTNTCVKGIKLSRNFGQHSAIEAGLGFVSGDWVVVLDCDLQDHPRTVETLWEVAQEGSDIVLVRRKTRTDAWHRRIFSVLFYKILSSLTGSKISPEIANFGLYNRKVINAYNGWSEEQKYFPVMIQWLGFDQRVVDAQHTDRYSGASSYNIRSLFSLGMRIVLSFSDRPLWIMSALGASVAVLSIFTSIFFVIQAFGGRVEVQGWTSLMLSLWFLGGVNIASAGLLGIYLGRALRESKGRPSYVVSLTTNVEP